MPATHNLGLNEPTTLILGAIHTCKIERHNDLYMHISKKQGRVEVVDIGTVQCLVGRVKNRGWSVIIDRSGDLARAASDLDLD